MTETPAGSETPRIEIDTFRKFWQRHALGPMLAPSCLVCGKNDYAEISIKHSELPGIVVCRVCREAPTLLTAAQKERDEQHKRGDILAEQACSHIKRRQEAEAKCEALAARVSVLFEESEAADDALDKDTYDELLKGDWGADDNDEIGIRAGTRRKCMKVFLAIDQIKKALTTISSPGLISENDRLESELAAERERLKAAEQRIQELENGKS